LVKGDIITKGAPHATLGLQAYTTATSPLRRYADLVVQRQLRAGLGLPESPLDERELDRILGEISFRMDQASLMERERTRYFLLKYLTQKKHVDFEATVLHRFPRFYLVYIKELAHRAVLRTPPGVNLNPHDRAVVRVEKVAPREDKLILSLVDLLPEYYQTSRAGL
jgi:exoribonuclease-2